MKEQTLPSRINMFVNNLLDILAPQEKPSPKAQPGKGTSASTRSRQERKDFSCYQPILDQDTQKIAGHLADISTGGFKLDCPNPVQANKDFRFLIKLTGEVADKPYMVFVARSKWCKIDPLDPYVYNVGYQLIHISPGDLEIFNRMMEKYGREHGSARIDLRRSNKW
jgi:hypothetical protein